MQELSPAVEGLDDLRLELRAGQTRRLPSWPTRWRGWGSSAWPPWRRWGSSRCAGGIVDVFGFGAPEPARIEFLGDEIESIRFFDILTQLSVRAVDGAGAPPGGPAPGARGGRHAVALRAAARVRRRRAGRKSLLDYLRRRDRGGAPGRRATQPELERTWSEVLRLHDAETTRGARPERPERLFLPAHLARARLDARSRSCSWRRPAVEPVRATFRFRALPPEAIDRDMPRLGELLRGARRRGEQTLILCDNQGQLERLQELLDELKVGARHRAGDRLARPAASCWPTREPAAARAHRPRDLPPHPAHPPAPSLPRRRRRWRAWRRSSRATTWCTWTTASASSGGWSGCAVGEEEFETLVDRVRRRRAAARSRPPRGPDRALGRRDAASDGARRPRCTASAARSWSTRAAEDAEGHPGDDGRAAGALRARAAPRRASPTRRHALAAGDGVRLPLRGHARPAPGHRRRQADMERRAPWTG